MLILDRRAHEPEGHQAKESSHGDRLVEEVGELLGGGLVQDLEDTVLDLMADPVKANIDVLGTALVEGLGSHEHGTLVVFVDRDRQDVWTREARDLESRDETVNPDSVLAPFAQGDVLGFG